jgi:peptidoglycan biosynthesis protein MviN/MurJ (putative lipid II flippase)
MKKVIHFFCILALKEKNLSKTNQGQRQGTKKFHSHICLMTAHPSLLLLLLLGEEIVTVVFTAKLS